MGTVLELAWHTASNWRKQAWESGELCPKSSWYLDELYDRWPVWNFKQPCGTESQKLCRKAFLFHTSEAGAGASAVMYSIVETAKANNLNIFQYLYMVLLYMPDYMNSSAGIEQLMPWSEFIKEQCSGIIDVESNVPENRIPLPCR